MAKPTATFRTTLFHGQGKHNREYWNNAVKYQARCSVTASGSIRRPAASSFFCFYGFQKIFSETSAQNADKFPNLPQMHNFGLGSRTHSPGFAKV